MTYSITKKSGTRTTCNFSSDNDHVLCAARKQLLNFQLSTLLRMSMFWIICILVITGEFLPVSGLTHSYHNSQSTVKAKINDKAILPCPVLQEVINKDGGYTYVQWYICTFKGSCDGEDPPWNWTAGMNQQGGQQSTRKGTSISSDGYLHIKIVHLHDLTKYMCKVSRVNSKSPLVNYVTLTRNANGTNQTTNNMISTKGPKTQDCKCEEASDNATSRGTATIIILIIFIVVLAILLVVALGYIMYVKDLVPRCCKRETRSDTPVRLSTLDQT